MAKLSKPDVSDAAVRAKTGKGWDEWFAILDAAGAQEMDHKAIVACLANEHQVRPWWQQKITVMYEQVRGTRHQHEQADGYQISRSKTVAAPLDAVYQAWLDDDQRQEWLPEAKLVKKSERQKKSEQMGAYIRSHWTTGDTSLDVDLYEKGENRTQVTVQHSKLKDAEQAEAHKTFWSEALRRLANLLEPKARE